MNKYIFLTAAATILLAGCTKNEIAVSTENSREISFAAYSGREATKAGTTTALQTGSFQVTATYKKGDAAATSYFTNEKYTWSTDKFVSAGETHYWPVDGGKLTFYATMPENNVTDATKKITPGATVDFNTDGQTDFMAAYLADQSGPSAQLAFNHKLTKVSFAAKGQDTGLKYVVKSITLTADSTATYTMGATGSWGTASNSKNFAVLTADSTIAKGTATYKNLGAPQLVIPSSGDAVSLNVKYQVYDGTSLVDDYSADGVTVDLSASAAGWGINKSFRYCLTLGLSSSVTPITFSAEQTDWTETSTKILDGFEDLREAVIGKSGNVTLSSGYSGNCISSIPITSNVTLKASSAITLDNSSSTPLFSIAEGATLTIHGGYKFNFKGTAAQLFDHTDRVVFESGTFEFDPSVYMNDTQKTTHKVLDNGDGTYTCLILNTNNSSCASPQAFALIYTFLNDYSYYVLGGVSSPQIPIMKKDTPLFLEIQITGSSCIILGAGKTNINVDLWGNVTFIDVSGSKNKTITVEQNTGVSIPINVDGKLSFQGLVIANSPTIIGGTVNYVNCSLQSSSDYVLNITGPCNALISGCDVQSGGKNININSSSSEVNMTVTGTSFTNSSESKAAVDVYGPTNLYSFSTNTYSGVKTGSASQRVEFDDTGSKAVVYIDGVKKWDKGTSY